MSNNKKVQDMLINLIKNAKAIVEVNIEHDIRQEHSWTGELQVIDTGLRIITIRLVKGDDKYGYEKENGEATT